jgi:hypothetical protein
MDSGHTGVFQRIGKAHKRVTKNGKTYWSGLPIRELYGPAIPDAVGNETVSKAVSQMIDRKFPAILAHEIGVGGAGAFAVMRRTCIKNEQKVLLTSF